MITAVTDSAAAMELESREASRVPAASGSQIGDGHQSGHCALQKPAHFPHSRNPRRVVLPNESCFGKVRGHTAQLQIMSNNS